MLISFIYFEEPPIPISVGLLQMNHDRNDTNCNFKNNNGNELFLSPSINIDNLNCNSDLDSADSYQCGLRCWNKFGSFIYKFKGVKFALYGTYDPSHQVIDVELDGIKIAQVNEAGPRKEYMLIYESDVYNYREHTIRISAMNQTYELYKLVYWPSLHAERKNASEFDFSDSFNLKSDGIAPPSKKFDFFVHEKWIYFFEILIF